MAVRRAQPSPTLSLTFAGTISSLEKQLGSALFQGRKHPGQPLAATGVAGLLPSRLFYITNRSTNLVDTGAKVSIIPPSRAEQQHQQDGFNLHIHRDLQ